MGKCINIWPFSDICTFWFCSYFDYLQTLEKQVDNDWDTVSASLEAIRNSFLSRKGALVNLTAESKLITKAESYVGSILQAFPSSLASETGTWNTCLEPLNEGLVVPTQVYSSTPAFYTLVEWNSLRNSFYSRMSVWERRFLHTCCR